MMIWSLWTIFIATKKSLTSVRWSPCICSTSPYTLSFTTAPLQFSFFFRYFEIFFRSRSSSRPETVRIHFLRLRCWMRMCPLFPVPPVAAFSSSNASNGGERGRGEEDDETGWEGWRERRG